MCFGSKSNSQPAALPAPAPTVPLKGFDDGTVAPTTVTPGPMEPTAPERKTSSGTGLTIPG